jgi:opacity protein-like surface antigen
MKKILFLAIGLMIAGSVSAQQYYYGPRRYHRPQQQNNSDFYRVKVGLTGGLNIANTVNGYNSNYQTGSIAGFNAGLYLDIPLVYPLSFEPEVLYSQKGYTAQITDGNLTSNLTSRSNFIDVPLLAKFHLAPGFNFLIGPQLSFLTSTTNTYDNGFNVTEQDHYNYNNNTTFVDGVIGFSVDINPAVELRARYTIDFNENDGNGTYTPDYRNQVYQIGLGFKFQ